MPDIEAVALTDQLPFVLVYKEMFDSASFVALHTNEIFFIAIIVLLGGLISIETGTVESLTVNVSEVAFEFPAPSVANTVML